MAKAPKVIQPELRPDGWQQFERAVDAAVKSGPMHKVAPKPKRKRDRAPVGKAGK